MGFLPMACRPAVGESTCIMHVQFFRGSCDRDFTTHERGRFHHRKHQTRGSIGCSCCMNFSCAKSWKLLYRLFYASSILPPLATECGVGGKSNSYNTYSWVLTRSDSEWSLSAMTTRATILRTVSSEPKASHSGSLDPCLIMIIHLTKFATKISQFFLHILLRNLQILYIQAFVQCSWVIRKSKARNQVRWLSYV